MNHIETLLMNQIRNSLETLQRTGVGFISQESSKGMVYEVDRREIMIRVCEITKTCGGSAPVKD